MLLHLYASYTWPLANPPTTNVGAKALKPGHDNVNGSISNGQANGYAGRERQQVRDAEEFELQGLIGEEGEEEEERGESSDGGRSPVKDSQRV